MIRLGFAICGSFCTFDTLLPVLRKLAEAYEITPVLSPAAAETDTRFGLADRFRREVRDICGRDPILTLEEAEPIGPKGLFDLLAVAPMYREYPGEAGRRGGGHQRHLRLQGPSAQRPAHRPGSEHQ